MSQKLPRLDEVFLTEAQQRYVLLVRPRGDLGHAYGPFGTEQAAEQFKKSIIAKGGDEGEAMEYDDDNGDVKIVPLETPSAGSLTGGRTP